MTTEAFDRIQKWVRLINQKPNYNCPFFYLSDNGKIIILDLSKMKDIPTTLNRIKDKETAHLFIDLDNKGIVRYYAYDICKTHQNIINEIEGELLFSIVEGVILKYIEDNIAELTTYPCPFAQLVEMNKGDYTKLIPSVTPPVGRHHTPYGNCYNTDEFKNNQARYYGVNSEYQSGSYGAAYKERDEFTTKLFTYIKQGRTGAAIDHIRNFFEKKFEEDKEVINNIYRFITIDKLDLLSFKELIKASEPMKDLLTERPTFIGKFKSTVMATRSRRANLLLKDIDIAA